jgi:hypothetical protein
MLDPIGSHGLYRPSTKDQYVFLLWDPPNSGARPPIPLIQTWSDAGPPASIGYYVFLPTIPDSNSALDELEQKIRSAQPTTPETTGFGWIKFTPKQFEIDGWVQLSLDQQQHPIVAKNVDITLPAAMLPFCFPKNLPVISIMDAGDLSGLAMTTPLPLPGAPALGVTIPLTGDLAGAICFAAFPQSFVSGDSTIKDLTVVRLYPPNPFDHQRNRTTPTGAQYLLSVNSSGDAYHLSALASFTKSRQ